MPKWIPRLHDPVWLREAYATQTTRQIAQDLGCVSAAVTQALHRHGIPTRPSGRAPAPHELRDREWLATQYLTSTTHHIAAQLGCAQITVLRALHQHGIPLRGRGRRPTAKTRYRKKLVHGRMMQAHRYLMEQHLGRRLATTEHVHHIDGNPSNNALSNLIVLTKSAHHKLHAQDPQHRRKHYESMQRYDAKRFHHICARCGAAFQGGNRAKYCPSCR